VVVDACDNYPTRYLLNDACARLGLPWVHGSVWRFGGQASVFGVPGAPCYRCLYPDPPEGESPTTAATGLLSPIPGIVGTLQATEALKLLLGIGASLAGRLLLIDALTMTFRTVTIPRDPSCSCCGAHATDDQHA
jgi:adenylyltransferase/sulfurtransferase